MTTAVKTADAEAKTAADHAFPLMLSRVTEAAAIASARLTGMGDKHEADHVAVEAMRKELGELPVSGRVVIGEGERDKAPMLYVGEELGAGGPEIDIAVDPLEGTNLCADGAPESIAVMATAERGGLFEAPDIYMDALVSGKEAKGKISLDAPVEKNLDVLAETYGREVSDLVVAVLERDRHDELVSKIRAKGARIKSFTDGTIIQAIAAMLRGDNVHAFMGTAAAPESVIKAAAAKCLGGHMEGRFAAYSDETELRMKEAGLDDGKIYTSDELATGNDVHVALTGVTAGTVVDGVRFFGGGMRTHTLVLSTGERAMRFLDTTHAVEREKLGFRLR